MPIDSGEFQPIPINRSTADILAQSQIRPSSRGRVLSLPFRLIILAACSVLAWTTPWTFLTPLSLVFVWFVWESRTRLEAWLLALVYFAAALWPIIPGYAGFFHDPRGPIVWASVVLVSTLPFGLLWLPFARGITVAAAFISHALMFGLASPVTALVMILSIFRPVPAPPAGWVGVDTELRQNEVSDFDRLQWMQNYALTHAGRTFVFPEGMIQAWTPGPWIDVAGLKANHKTIIFGAITREEGGYRNNVFVVGESTAIYQQRMPLPIGMLGNGFLANINGPSIIPVGDDRAEFALCFEQVLPLSLVGLSEHPDVLVAPANLNWARHAPAVEWTEQRSVQAWARLFGVPVVTAVNR